MKAFFNELRRAGYVKGQNLLIDRYSGEGRAMNYPELARDVVRSNPDLILALGNNLTHDLKAATTTIPIVGLFGNPVEDGLVASLARPGGRMTRCLRVAGGEIDLGCPNLSQRSVAKP